MKQLLVFLFCLAPLAAQGLTYGVKGGVSAQDNYFSGFTMGANDRARSYYTSKARRYVVGPTFTHTLPKWRLSVELDALYRRVNYDGYGYSYAGGEEGYHWISATANRFDVPLLLRWDAPRRFYVVGGPMAGVQFREVQHVHSWNRYWAGTDYAVKDTTSDYKPSVATGVGSTYGIGYDYQRFGFHWKPEIRYSVWHKLMTDYPTGLTQKREEFQFLIGIERTRER